MQPLYTEDEFKEAKSRQLLPLKCLHCQSVFHKSKHSVQKSLSESYDKKDFCSHRCHILHKCPPVILSCEQCHKTFKKLPSDIKSTKHHFCCQSCAAKYNNAHKTKGTRISKLEV